MCFPVFQNFGTSYTCFGRESKGSEAREDCSCKDGMYLKCGPNLTHCSRNIHVVADNDGLASCFRGGGEICKATTCRPCPEGFSCPGFFKENSFKTEYMHAQPILNTGYFASSSEPYSALYCKSEEACLWHSPFGVLGGPPRSRPQTLAGCHPLAGWLLAI